MGNFPSVPSFPKFPEEELEKSGQSLAHPLRIEKIPFITEYPSDCGHLSLQKSPIEVRHILSDVRPVFLSQPLGGVFSHVPLFDVFASAFRVRDGNEPPVIPNAVKDFLFGADHRLLHRYAPLGWELGFPALTLRLRSPRPRSGQAGQALRDSGQAGWANF